MAEMNILAISYCFLPWLAPRSIQESRILGAIAENGHNVTIIQGAVSEMTVPLDYELSAYVNPRIRTVEIETPRAIGWRIANLLIPLLKKIPDSANAWAVRASQKALSILHDHTVLLTFSTPVSGHLAGLLVKRKNREMPWAAFFSDPFMENPYIKMSPIVQWLNSRLERYIIESADAVIFVNQHTRECTMAKYPPSWDEKAHVIPHAFDERLYPKESPSPEQLLTIRYMGDLYGKRTPESLFKALRVVSDKSQEVIVEIYGYIDNDMRSLITRYGLDAMVKHMGRISYLENISMMKTADILLTIDAPVETNLFLPSKLIDYIGAQRPILAITSERGPTAEIVREMGCPSFRHEDTQGIADRILLYIEQKAKGQLEVNVPETVLNRYRAQYIGAQYISVLNGIANL